MGTIVPMLGRTLGHYRILEKLGSGGMGDVYAAHDTKLDRQVALKVLPPEMEERGRERFEQEAKAVAALDHPNIVHVYSVEEADGVQFITMQLVRGKTLTELLPASGFPLAKFFEIAIPLVDAVATAHREGITHRDLKPDNVMVSDDGRVQVLDFGLAKVKQQLTGLVDSELPTRAATREGHIVGTPSYMSPEQAEGKSVDARSDIFSLGIVFYEMLTGGRPFSGDTPTAVLSSILKDTPHSVSELRPAVPRDLARLVRRCLAKDPLDRYQTAIDLRHDLEETKQDVDSGDLLPARSETRRSRKKPALAFALVLLVIAAGIWWLRSREIENEVVVPQLRNPVQVTSALGVENHPTWSPDGERLAYEAGDFLYRDVWVAQLGSGEPVRLTGDHPGDDALPSWSPDGRHIAFFSNRGGSYGVYVVPAIGGSPRSVLSPPDVSIPRSPPEWSRDGATLAVPLLQGEESAVVLVSLDSLESERIVMSISPGNELHGLAWSPDGRRFAYIEGRTGNAEVTRLWTMPRAGGESVPLTDGRTLVRSPSWSADGRQVFYISNRVGSPDLWQQTVMEDGRPIGEPRPVTQGLGIQSAVFSHDGRKLAYSRGQPVSNVWRVPLLADRPATWADAEPITSEIAYIEYVDVSPDGESLAVSSDRSGNQDLWILPSEGGEITRLTTDVTPDWAPVWSPDGEEIAFYAYRSGNRDIWVIPSRGGPARQLTSHPARDSVPTWSPDGEAIAFVSTRSGESKIWIVDATGEGEPRRLTSGSGRETLPAWAPAGDWLAFSVRESSLFTAELYRVSTEGGEPTPLPGAPGPVISLVPRFSPDGRALYYSDAFGPDESRGIWRLSLEDRARSRIARLEGRRGSLGYQFAVDDRFLYFLWGEDVGDLWVMDVVTDD